MRVTTPGILLADPDRGVYFAGWGFEVDEGTVYASEEALRNAQVGAILGFIAAALGVDIAETFEARATTDATMAIMRAASRDS